MKEQISEIALRIDFLACIGDRAKLYRWVKTHFEIFEILYKTAKYSYYNAWTVNFQSSTCLVELSEL